jgi:hypothetical protein
MYLPLELNTPLAVGGFIAYLLSRSSKNKDLATKRQVRGILIASGFIAGGALVGVISAILKNIQWEKYIRLNWSESTFGEPLSLIMFIALALFLYFDSKRIKGEN